MPIDRFIKERKTVWQRLEELLARLDQMTLRRLHREEVRELGRIYRRTASDLAIARSLQAPVERTDHAEESFAQAGR